MQMTKAWIVTYWTESGVAQAMGPDDPDEEAAVLLFLSEPAAHAYRANLSDLSARVLPVYVHAPLLST